MKTLNILLVLSLVAGSVSANAQNITRNSKKQSQQSKQGGADTGGGNGRAYEIQPVSYKRLENGVMRAATYLRPFLQSQEIQYKRNLLDPNTPRSYLAIPGRIYAKFFLNPNHTVYDVLDKITINIQDDPCLDKDESGNEIEVDASITDKEMCLSLKRLWKRLTNENLYTETIALMMHELSHPFGEKHPKDSKEIDPILIFQQVIAMSVPSNGEAAFLERPRDLFSKMQIIFENLDLAWKFTETKDFNQTTIHLELLQQSLWGFYEEVANDAVVYTKQVSFLTRQQLINLHDAGIEIKLATILYRNNFSRANFPYEDFKNVPAGMAFTPSVFENPMMTMHKIYAPDIKARSMICVGYRDQASLRKSLENVRKTLLETRAQFQKWKPESLGIYRFSGDTL